MVLLHRTILLLPPTKAQQRYNKLTAKNVTITIKYDNHALFSVKNVGYSKISLTFAPRNLLLLLPKLSVAQVNYALQRRLNFSK